MNFYEQLIAEMSELKESGLFVTIRTLNSAQGAWFEVDGKKVLNLCSNNYLGFANNERLKKAAIEAVEKYGVGPGAVRSIAGTMDIHHQLEKELASFKKTEATLVVQSGFNANQAVIPAITTAEDAILSDELNHASIIDGVRLSKAKKYVWKHKDVKNLEEKLKEAKDNGARRLLIITDGVFSMDGDLAPLPEIVEVFHLHGRVDIEVGTLSKAFGVVGGFVAGKKELIEYLKQKARPFLFSSSLSPAETGAALEAVRILTESGDVVKKLWDNAKYFKDKLNVLGFDTWHSETPITPVMLYDAKVAKEFSLKLFEEGIFAQSIGYPTVPKGLARIRVMISAAHTKEDLDFAVEKFEKIGKELNIIK
ncbi:MAG: 8-amino-7-oxononanoate synthase [Marinitoga sp. 4572_148]|nr:MAG: 8-amino-7-oxononanoate synthase [Marinitoga sp. 4572_148]